MAETNANTSITCSCKSNQAISSIAPGGLNPEASSRGSAQAVDRLKLLYPNVNENETPLPRIWNRVDKHLSIRLSPNNLRVQYKGTGKQSASVRTAHPIPSTCGIYYFEVKIISNGKPGYIAIGLTSLRFRMNRLPGWNKKSYGFHGDDGYVYSSRDLGYKYGPTFNTGDIIGCCFNMVNNILFFTMNGKDMGTAFQNLPKKLYPTVGLQTRGEEIEVNFGQQPFKFTKIVSMMEEMRSEMMSSIQNFSLNSPRGNSKNVMEKLVSAYLVHYGYSATAEAFTQATGQNLAEDIDSIKTRLQISTVIMDGHVSEAIEMTLHLYPGVLENNKNLWFMLQCREFIEMTIKVAALELGDNKNSSIAETTTQTTTAIETTATETATTTTETTTTPTETTTTATEKTITATETTTAARETTTTETETTATETTTTPTETTTTATKTATAVKETTTTASETTTAAKETSTAAKETTTTATETVTTATETTTTPTETTTTAAETTTAAKETTITATETVTTATETTTTPTETTTTATETATTATATPTTTITTAPTTTATNNDQNCIAVTVINTKSDVENQTNSSENDLENSNGNACASGSTDNSKNAKQKLNALASPLSPSTRLERLLGLCKDLSFTGQQLEKENKLSDDERNLMQDSISSLAYTDPWKSPLRRQLCPSNRESVCRALNSAILEKFNKDKLPHLELCVAHAGELLKVMSLAGLGESAYAHISEVFPKEAANKKGKV